MVNVLISKVDYELCKWSRDLRDLSAKLTLGDCLFQVVNLTKNANPDKYGNSIGFDESLQLSLPICHWGKNVIIFGVYISSPVRSDNRNKN